MTDQERLFLSEARTFLENPSFLIRMANQIGRPIEKGMRFLPEKARTKVHGAVRKSLEEGVKVVTRTVPATMGVEVRANDSDSAISSASEAGRKQGQFHSAATFLTGAVGGFFGMASLPIELPLSTAIMLRSIIAIANDFGFDIKDPEVQLECLYVLSLGSSQSTEDDALGSAYWASRMAFMDLIRQAAREVGRTSAPMLVKLLAAIAVRFETVVSEKLVAEAVPVLGAIGGGAINLAFTRHFSDCARYHFGLRALEKKYGEQAVHEGYRV